MPRLFVLLLVACSLAASGQTPQAASMPREKAEATFRDPRVLAFLKNVMDGFKVSCTLSDPATTKAIVTLPNIAPGASPATNDFASTWYEVVVPCSGITTLTINAEFTPLSGDRPLDLVLSLKQVLKR